MVVRLTLPPATMTRPTLRWMIVLLAPTHVVNGLASVWNGSQILFMRHGHVNYTAGGVGPVDPALFPDIETYKDIAAMFADASEWPDMILVSPMRRTMQTMLWSMQYPLAGRAPIPVVEDPRIEEVPCTEGIYESNMGTPREFRDWNITNLQDVDITFPANAFNNSMAGRVVHEDYPSWAGRRLIGQVAAKSMVDVREYMGIRLPGIGYEDYTATAGSSNHIINHTIVDKWLAWESPRGARYCGDRSQNDFSAKVINLKGWFKRWTELNPRKRLAVVTHSWLMHHVLGVCKNAKFMSVRAVNGTWEIAEDCSGGHTAPASNLILV